MNDERVRALISDMVRPLITYEIELTAYQTVYNAVSDRLLDAGLDDIDLRKMLAHVASSLPLQAEAEAEYAALFGVMQDKSSDPGWRSDFNQGDDRSQKRQSQRLDNYGCLRLL
jgi:hypothetical protein